MLLLLLLLSRYGCCCATVWGTPRLGRRGNGHSLSLGTGRYSSLAAAAGRDPMTTRKRMADLHVIRRVLPIIFDMHHRAAGGWPPVSWEVVPLSPAQPPGVLGRVCPVLRLALREVVPFMRSLGHMRRWFAGYSRLATETGVVPCNAQPVACEIVSLSRLAGHQRGWSHSERSLACLCSTILSSKPSHLLLCLHLPTRPFPCPTHDMPCQTHALALHVFSICIKTVRRWRRCS